MRTETVWFPTFFTISSFVFHSRKPYRLGTTWWKNFSFWLNGPFKQNKDDSEKQQTKHHLLMSGEKTHSFQSLCSPNKMCSREPFNRWQALPEERERDTEINRMMSTYPLTFTELKKHKHSHKEYINTRMKQSCCSAVVTWHLTANECICPLQLKLILLMDMMMPV